MNKKEHIDNIKSYMTHLAYRIKIQTKMDLQIAIHKAGAEFGKLSTDAVKIAMLKTATSELGHNILKYADIGTIYIYVVTEPKMGIKIISKDKGPGIKDIKQAMQDNFSSSGTLGLGLPGVKRMVDEFSLETEVNIGTTVTITFYA